MKQLQEKITRTNNGRQFNRIKDENNENNLSLSGSQMRFKFNFIERILSKIETIFLNILNDYASLFILNP